MQKLLFLTLLLTGYVVCHMYQKAGCTKDAHGNEHCLKKDEFEEDDEEEPFFYEQEDILKEREPLFQWDPVKVGYERELEMDDGHKMKIVTAALKPKVFIIDNFLTDEECNHVIEKAKYFGLGESGLHIDEKIKKDKVYSYGKNREAFGNFKEWDKNDDNKITTDEVIEIARKNLKLYINSTDVQTMFDDLKSDAINDGMITVDEFAVLNTAGVVGYLRQLREEHPRFRDRYSEQIWLKQGDSSDTIMKRLREKVIKITNLPRYIVEGGEPLQVLRYRPFGHYHAHFDGQDGRVYPDYKCCHMDYESQPTDCRICRYITILYYLNEVEEGGETAFPVADDANYNHKEFRERKVEDYYNLSKFCHQAKLVVKSKKGRAVMWYNHHMDDHGWLGDMDYYALHGGCDIIKGTKWVANNWITAPPMKYAHMDSLYYNLETEDAF